MRQFTAAVCTGLFALAAHGQELDKAPRTMSAGQWEVARMIDPMTDKVDCIGVYKPNPRIQLSDLAMYIPQAGGLETITVRFDDEPARPSRLANRIEQRGGLILLEGAEFASAVAAKRLRYQALTRFRGLETGEISMESAPAIIEHIKAGCPAK